MILEKDFFPAEKGSASKIAELIVLKVYPFYFCINLSVFFHRSNPLFLLDKFHSVYSILRYVKNRCLPKRVPFPG